MIYGAHLATAGKLLETPARAAAMGAGVLQIFVSNPRGWRPTIYSDETAASFRQATKEAGIKQVFAHMIYLTSYGTPNAELRGKSITALSQTLKSADQLGITGVVTHFGSHKGLGLEQALDRITAAFSEAMAESKDSYLILENSAGSGNNIGNSIDELALIMEGMKRHPRVKICLDTAHLLASGYEIRNPKAWSAFLAEFDQKIGLSQLVILHLNDSKVDIGTRVDRHENIGDGHIGESGFKAILNAAELRPDLPGVLEVPGLDGKGPDAGNIKRLQKLTK